MAPTDTCITCNEPSRKNFPLYKCSSCGNSIHRKCATTTSNSNTFNCAKCILDKAKENDKKKKENKGVDSASKRASLTKKNTPTTVCSQTTTLNTVLSRRSNIVNNGKPSTSCKCIEVVRNELMAWENKIIERVNSLCETVQQHTTQLSTTITNEIAGLQKTFEPILHSFQQFQPSHEKSTESAKHQPHLNSINRYNNNNTFSNSILNYESLATSNFSIQSNFNNNTLSNNFNNNNNKNIPNNNNNNINSNNDYNIDSSFSKDNISYNNSFKNISAGKQNLQITSNNNNNNNNNDHPDVHKVQTLGTTSNRLNHNYYPYPTHPTISKLNNKNSSTFIRPEDSEIFIAGFMHFNDDDDINLICLSILRGIVPSITANEISGTRLIHKRNSNINYPSIIVQLTSKDRTNDILTYKKDRNYYSTKDIDRSLLNQELLKRLPPTKIIINDVLPSTEYKTYTSLKTIAKNLGFAFVWHSRGKFLVRWSNKDRAHTFQSITDLNTIRDTYINRQSLSINQNNLAENITNSSTCTNK